jgi:hypothetical protein
MSQEKATIHTIAKATADIEDLMGRLFAQGYTDLQVYRMLGLSSEADWQWLADVRAEPPALTPR